MTDICTVSVSPEKDSLKLVRKLAAAKLGLKTEEISELKIIRRSIDARKKAAVKIIYSVRLSTKIAGTLSSGKEKKEIEAQNTYTLPAPAALPVERPVVAGFGPAGIFAALAMAEAGLKPLIIERGSDVDTRSKKVSLFTDSGILDPECNVQFGEGGAGTFSDGKLNTGIGGSCVGWILQRFAEFGAGEHIVYDAAPHMGTDVLRAVVKNIRERIISLGGTVSFDTKLTDILIKDQKIKEITVCKKGIIEKIPCETLFLAIGHSARDTMNMLYEKAIAMEAKPFAMGVRIEHKRRQIDEVQYGKFAGLKSLGAAPYKLAVHLPDGTGVYTFCMCPGGYVMAAASESGGIVTNGMSYSGRAGENSNSALLVSLTPAQFPYEGPLGGIRWQREIEQRAFEAGGSDYSAPCQLVGDFLNGTPSACCHSIEPSYRPGVSYGSLETVLPKIITEGMKQALPLLDRKLNGFAAQDAVMTGPETRSSSPVRILRGSDLQSIDIEGLYPCGEGAGWAGGIVSAASDALKCCEKYLLSLK